MRPIRIYQNDRTSQTSPILADVIGHEATIRRGFTCGLRRGTWFDSPFVGVSTVPPVAGQTPKIEAALPQHKTLPLIFQAICRSIESSWEVNRYHVVFMSSGWDSRIIAAAIKYLAGKLGQEWLGMGLMFLANEWESVNAQAIHAALGIGRFLAYRAAVAGAHFSPWLFSPTFWREVNAPIPVPGNLWYYLPDFAQQIGELPDDKNLQGYSGLWANETWQHWPHNWQARYKAQYYYNVNAVWPFKIPRMEFPLIDPDVLGVVARTERRDGVLLRQALARYACPEGHHIERLEYDDRHHAVSLEVQQMARREYFKTWYSAHVVKDWSCPTTSDFSRGWSDWSLANLCEALLERGYVVKVM